MHTIARSDGDNQFDASVRHASTVADVSLAMLCHRISRLQNEAEAVAKAITSNSPPADLHDLTEQPAETLGVQAMPTSSETIVGLPALRDAGDVEGAQPTP